MSNAKDELQALLTNLTNDCSVEDIQYHLYVIEKVRQGLESADTKGTVSQKDVEQHLAKWLVEPSF